MSIVARQNLGRLADVIRGRIWFPGDPDFDRAHRPWNLAVEQAVHAVVEAADAEDVADLVAFARDNGLEVATQPSGHGATGRATGAILLRTTLLDTITVDAEAMTATIGAGVRSGDLQRAAAAHGLTALPGSSPVVTVVGAALGGGLSWFGRAFGWIADSILAADVVMADGTARHVSAESDPEMLWALRGGGGDLVIVTSLQLRLRPAPALFGGRQLWSASHATAVAQAYRTMTATAPESLTLWLELLHFPGGEPMIAIDSTYLGDAGEARDLMSATDALPAPLSDTRAAMSVAEIGTITAEPTDPGPGQSRVGPRCAPLRSDRPADDGADSPSRRCAREPERQPARGARRALRRVPVRRASHRAARRPDRREAGERGRRPPHERSEADDLPESL